MAQLKATVLLMPNGSDRITSAPLQELRSGRGVEDPELRKLLAASLKSKKKSKPRKGKDKKKADGANGEGPVDMGRQRRPRGRARRRRRGQRRGGGAVGCRVCGTLSEGHS